MARPLFVLHAGDIVRDGVGYHVPAEDLIRLYGLRRGDYFILERPGWEFCLPHNVVHLYPRDDGNYDFPGVLDGRA